MVDEFPDTTCPIKGETPGTISEVLQNSEQRKAPATPTYISVTCQQTLLIPYYPLIPCTNFRVRATMADSSDVRQLLGQRTGRANIPRSVSEYSEAPSVYSRHYDDSPFEADPSEPYPFASPVTRDKGSFHDYSSPSTIYATPHSQRDDDGRMSVLGPKMKFVSKAPWENEQDVPGELPDESENGSIFGGNHNQKPRARKKEKESSLAKGLALVTIAAYSAAPRSSNSSERPSLDSAQRPRKESIEIEPHPGFTTFHSSSSSSVLPLASPSGSVPSSAAKKVAMQMQTRLRTLSGGTRSSPSNSSYSSTETNAVPPVPSPRSTAFDRSGFSSPSGLLQGGSLPSPVSMEFPTRSTSPSRNPNGRNHPYVDALPNGSLNVPHPVSSPLRGDSSSSSATTISPSGSHKFPESSSTQSMATRPAIREISLPQSASASAPFTGMAGWGGYAASPTFKLVSLEQAQAQEREARERSLATPSENETYGHRVRTRTKSGPLSKLSSQDAVAEAEARSVKPKRSFMALFKNEMKEKDDRSIGQANPPHRTASPPPPLPLVPLVPPLPHSARTPGSPVVSTLPITFLSPDSDPAADPFLSSKPSNSAAKRVPPPALAVVVTSPKINAALGPVNGPPPRRPTPQRDSPPVPDQLSVKSIVTGAFLKNGAQAASAPPSFTEFAGLSLRPVSVNFSNTLPQDLLHTPTSSPFNTSSTASLSTASLTSSRSTSGSVSNDVSPSLLNSDSGPSLPSLQDQILSSKMVWLRQIAELESQVRDLKVELEDLKAGQTCVCGNDLRSKAVSGDSQEKKSILHRPRARTGGNGRIVLGSGHD